MASESSRTNGDDEWVYTTELVTSAQIEALNRLLALPVKEGPSIQWPDEDE